MVVLGEVFLLWGRLTHSWGITYCFLVFASSFVVCVWSLRLLAKRFLLLLLWFALGFVVASGERPRSLQHPGFLRSRGSLSSFVRCSSQSFHLCGGFWWVLVVLLGLGLLPQPNTLGSWLVVEFLCSLSGTGTHSGWSLAIFGRFGHPLSTFFVRVFL